MKCKRCGCPFVDPKTGLCEWCERRGSFGAPRNYPRPPIIYNQRASIVNGLI